MSESRHTVIIGGGVIGLSVAYHLGHLGIDDVLLLERNELTSGTSWHAAGIVGPLRASQNLTTLASYAVELFQRLESETGQATGYRITGGYFLAGRPERMTELRRIAAMGEMNDLVAEIVTPDAISERYPFIRTDDLAGGMWVEKDGQINPVDLCMAYARGARALGVEIREHCGVTGFEKSGRRVSAVTLVNGGRIECENVINCTGLWAREVGQMAGVAIPVQAVEHMYAVTEPVAGLPQPCPVLRDLESGIYIKEDAGRLVFGAFEANAKLWHPASSDPGDMYLMFDDDLDHAEPMIEAGLHRVPALDQTGIQSFLTGPESFTPDTRQVMGRAPELDNYFVAAGLNSIGIMSSAGVGRTMAEWIVDGDPALDMWEVDVSRFRADDADQAFLDRRTPEAVHNQLDMHWPYKQFRTGRDRYHLPLHDAWRDRGAVFGAVAGWERPLWFAREGEDTAIVDSHTVQNWWGPVERESLQLARSGALFDLTPFTKLRVCGRDAATFLQRLCTNDIARSHGRAVYTLMLNRRGGIEGELTVTRIDDETFLLVSASATRTRDRQWLDRQLTNERVTIEDVTGQFAVLGLMGPNSRAALADLCGQEISGPAFGFGSSRQLELDGVPVRATRLSFVGELGWELMVPWSATSAVWESLEVVLARHDIGPAGLFCLESGRLEKGYLHWGHDIGPEDSPLEAGLGFAVCRDKPGGFIGREALVELATSGVRRRLQLFAVPGDRPLLLHDEPVYRAGRRIGKTTSGGLGFRTDTALTLAYVEVDELDPAAHYEIEIAGERRPLEMLEQVPYDPSQQRLRSS